MMKNIIACDLDFTLHNYYLAASKVVKEVHGIDIVNSMPAEWSQFLMPMDGSKVFTEEELRFLFNRSQDRDMIFASDPYPGAVEALHVLSNLGYELKYFTDRKLHSRQDTEDWLIHHNFPTPTNIVVSKDKRKEIILLKDNLITLIDDRVRTMIWARFDLGLDTVFSIKHPFNCNLSDVDGVHLENDWYSLLGRILIELRSPN